MFAQVIVDIAHSQVDKIFEYSCSGDLAVGSRVKVPFGKTSIDGFVIGISETSEYPPEKVKPIISVFDELPALIPECFSLMERISSRFRVPKAAALRLFLPTEMRRGTVREVYRTIAKINDIAVSIPKNAQKQRLALDFLKDKREYDFTALCNTFGRGAVNALVEKGAFTTEKIRKVRNPFTDLQKEEKEKVLT